MKAGALLRRTWLCNPDVPGPGLPLSTSARGAAAAGAARTRGTNEVPNLGVVRAADPGGVAGPERASCFIDSWVGGEASPTDAAPGADAARARAPADGGAAAARLPP